MKLIRKAPLFKLALFFISGIIATDYFQEWPIYIGLLALLIAISCILLDKKLLGWQAEYLTAASIYIATMGFGAGVHFVNTYETGVNTHYINCRNVQLTGTIASKVKDNNFGKKAWLELKKLDLGEEQIAISGKILLYIPDSNASDIHHHSKVKIKANIRDVRSRFSSYLQYLHRNGIYHVAYVEQIKVLGIEKSIQWYAEQIQTYLSIQLEQIIPDANLKGIAKAMFIGEKTAIEQDTRDIFAQVGASHILAISGLHIGMIYLMLSWLFQYLHLIPHGKRVKNLLILIILLGYMCITGAAPAVVRAVCMYGCILLFKISYQRYHILNILAISAFIQLLWDSTIIYHIGFQLSYVAVIGIVSLFPVFEAWFPTEHIFLKKLYACIGVTICATLATTPLVMIYFGQFPTYFLLTNLLITLITGGTVFAGFLTVICIGIPYVNQVCGFICYIFLRILFQICEWVASLPYTLITDISLSNPAVYILLLQLIIAWGILTIPTRFKRKFDQPVHPCVVVQIAS